MSNTIVRASFRGALRVVSRQSVVCCYGHVKVVTRVGNSQFSSLPWCRMSNNWQRKAGSNVIKESFDPFQSRSVPLLQDSLVFNNPVVGPGRCEKKEGSVWLHSVSSAMSNVGVYPNNKVLRIGLIQSVALSTYFSDPSKVDPFQDIEVLMKKLVQLAKEANPSCTSPPFLDMIVLPEMWNTPYHTSFFPRFHQPLPDPDMVVAGVGAQLSRLARQYGVWLVGGSVPEQVKQQTYNTCLVFDPHGNVVGKHRKLHLFDISVQPDKNPNSEEILNTTTTPPAATSNNRTTKPGITFRESDTLSAGSSLTCFPTPFGTVGLGICYDLRFPQMSTCLSLQRGASLLVFPGAFNHVTGPAHWELLLRARAVDTQTVVIGCSLALPYLASLHSQTPSALLQPDEPHTSHPHDRLEKNTPPNAQLWPAMLETDYKAYGHSMVVDPWGTVRLKLDKYPGIGYCEIDLNLIPQVRTSIPTRNQLRSDLY